MKLNQSRKIHETIKISKKKSSHKGYPRERKDHSTNDSALDTKSNIAYKLSGKFVQFTRWKAKPNLAQCIFPITIHNAT